MADDERNSGMYYQWRVAGKRITIQVALHLVDRIAVAIRNARDRGADAAGILIGRTTYYGEPIIAIDDVQFLPDNSLGDELQRYPNPFTSRIASMAVREPSGSPAFAAVGWFRSTRSARVSVPPADVDLFTRCFPRCDQVLLIVSSAPEQTDRAGFFFWDDGTCTWDRSYREFPFSTETLEQFCDLAAPEQAPDHIRPLFTGACVEPLPGRAGTIPAKMPSRRRWLIASPVLVLVLLVAGRQIRGRDASTTISNDVNLVQPSYVTVLQDNGQYRLKWDPTIPPIRAAVRGRLIIVDGGVRKHVELSALNLSYGTIVYFSTTPAVTFRLELFDNTGARVREGTSETTGTDFLRDHVNSLLIPPHARNDGDARPVEPITLGCVSPALALSLPGRRSHIDGKARVCDRS